MGENRPASRPQSPLQQQEPSLAALLDPIALEERLKVARARRAEAIAQGAVARVPAHPHRAAPALAEAPADFADPDLPARSARLTASAPAPEPQAPPPVRIGLASARLAGPAPELVEARVPAEPAAAPGPLEADEPLAAPPRPYAVAPEGRAAPSRATWIAVGLAFAAGLAAAFVASTLFLGRDAAPPPAFASGSGLAGASVESAADAPAPAVEPATPSPAPAAAPPPPQPAPPAADAPQAAAPPLPSAAEAFPVADRPRPRPAPPPQPADAAPAAEDAQAAAPSDLAPIVVHVPNAVADPEVAGALSAAAAAGPVAPDAVRVGFAIGRTHVRYYHPEDARRAGAVAAALSDGQGPAEVRDFTYLAQRPRPGTVEAWMAGAARAGATRRAAATGRPVPKHLIEAARRDAAEGARTLGAGVDSAARRLERVIIDALSRAAPP